MEHPSSRNMGDDVDGMLINRLILVQKGLIIAQMKGIVGGYQSVYAFL